MSAGMEETNASITQVGEIMNNMMDTLARLAEHSETGTRMTEDIQEKAETVEVLSGEQLSRNAESLKQDADKNLMIADALKNESGKFKI